MLEETDSSDEDEINSIVSLLRIQPAQINTLKLNEQESVIYDLIKKLDAKVSTMTFKSGNATSDLISNTTQNMQTGHTSPQPKSVISGKSFEYILKNHPELINSTFYYKLENGATLGSYLGKTNTGQLYFNNGAHSDNLINDTEEERNKIIGK